MFQPKIYEFMTREIPQWMRVFKTDCYIPLHIKQCELELKCFVIIFFKKHNHRKWSFYPVANHSRSSKLAYVAASEALWTSAFYAIWNYATSNASSRHLTSVSLISLGIRSKPYDAKRLYSSSSLATLPYGKHIFWKFSWKFSRKQIKIFQKIKKIFQEIFLQKFS